MASYYFKYCLTKGVDKQNITFNFKPAIRYSQHSCAYVYFFSMYLKMYYTFMEITNGVTEE